MVRRSAVVIAFDPYSTPRPGRQLLLLFASCSHALSDQNANISMFIFTSQGNRASEAFDECSQEVIAPSCLFELHAV
jgi:hypothetical protein